MKFILALILVSYIASASGLQCHQCNMETVGEFSGVKTAHTHKCYDYEDLGSPQTCADPREWCYFEYKHQNRNRQSPKDVWKGCKMPSDNAKHRKTKDGNMICEDEMYNQKNPYVVASICYCKTDFCNSKANNVYATTILFFICAIVAIFN